MTYFDHRHGNVALAGLRNAIKILTTSQPHLERAGCAEWVRRMISVEAFRLDSLRAEAERSMHEHEQEAQPHEPLADTTTPDAAAQTAEALGVPDAVLP